MKVILKVQGCRNKTVTLSESATIFAGIDSFPYHRIRFSIEESLRKKNPDSKLPIIFDSVDKLYTPKDKVSIVRNLKNTNKDQRIIIFTASPEVLCSVDKNTDKVFKISKNGIVEIKDFEFRIHSIGEIASRIFEVDSIYPDIYNKDICDYHYLTSDPYRNDEDNERLRLIKERLDAANIVL